jgi:hypothetical protein
MHDGRGRGLQSRRRARENPISVVFCIGLCGRDEFCLSPVGASTLGGKDRGCMEARDIAQEQLNAVRRPQRA